LESGLPEGAEVVYNDGAVQVVAAKSVDSVCDLARGTKWCTSDEDQAESYISGDRMDPLEITPLYVIYLKGKKTAQLFPGYWHQVPEFQDLRGRDIPIDATWGEILWKTELLQKVFESLERLETDLLADEELIKEWTKFPKGKCEIYMIRSVKPYMATAYAINVLEERWPQAEPVILTDNRTASDYWKAFFGGWRWPEAEDAFFSNPTIARNYMMTVKHTSPVEYEELKKERGIPG